MTEEYTTDVAKTSGIELTVEEMVDLRKAQIEVVKKIMKKDVHYGLIPGAKRPSLWQPGAQVLDTLHGYAPTFTLMDKIEDWEKGFFNLRYLCRIIRRRDGKIVGEGVGSCNSKEKKYRTAVYHGEDEGKPVDPRDNVNTYDKMAVKRAHIAGTLNATGLSDIFTQDVEDMQDQFSGKDSEEKSKDEHQCPIHHQAFKQFKKGNAMWYAHSYKDANGKTLWCNEADTLNKPKLEPATEVPEEQDVSPLSETEPLTSETSQGIALNKFYLIAISKKPDGLDYGKREKVWQSLAVTNMNSWIAQGKSYEDALNELATLQGVTDWRTLKTTQ